LRCFGLGATRHDGFAKVEVDAAAARRRQVADQVRPWSGSPWGFVRDLQDAGANHGRVELMRDASSGDRLAAVKRMPTTWVCPEPAEFDARHPTAHERPWLDVGLVHHLGKLGYPHVCRLHSIFRGDKDTYVVSDFCEVGDLFDWCFRGSLPEPGPMREALVRPVAVQTLNAVRWLHDLGIAHRDLSLENIMLARADGGLQVKLIDFGMATLSRTVRHEVRGKPNYQPPEVHTQAVTDTYLGDSFALGVVLFSLALEDFPWKSTRRCDCSLYGYVASFGFRRFLRKRRLRIKRHGELISEVLSPELTDVLDALLQIRPRKRASLGEAAFDDEVARGRRRSVWSLAYLQMPEPHKCVAGEAFRSASTCADSTCSELSIGWSASDVSSLDRAPASGL